MSWCHGWSTFWGGIVWIPSCQIVFKGSHVYVCSFVHELISVSDFKIYYVWLNWMDVREMGWIRKKKSALCPRRTNAAILNLHHFWGEWRVERSFHLVSFTAGSDSHSQKGQLSNCVFFICMVWQDNYTAVSSLDSTSHNHFGGGSAALMLGIPEGLVSAHTWLPNEGENQTQHKWKWEPHFSSHEDKGSNLDSSAQTSSKQPSCVKQ